jgi:hypothetical protein
MCGMPAFGPAGDNPVGSLIPWADRTSDTTGFECKAGTLNSTARNFGPLRTARTAHSEDAA